jgi:hypothetical protein
MEAEVLQKTVLGCSACCFDHRAASYEVGPTWRSQLAGNPGKPSIAFIQPNLTDAPHGSVTLELVTADF